MKKSEKQEQSATSSRIGTVNARQFEKIGRRIKTNKERSEEKIQGLDWGFQENDFLNNKRYQESGIIQQTQIGYVQAEKFLDIDFDYDEKISPERKKDSQNKTLSLPADEKNRFEKSSNNLHPLSVFKFSDSVSLSTIKTESENIIVVHYKVTVNYTQLKLNLQQREALQTVLKSGAGTDAFSYVQQSVIVQKGCIISLCFEDKESAEELIKELDQKINELKSYGFQ